MDFFDLINMRESTRNYLDKPVEQDKILRIIEAARLAPSACNSQPWKFIIINDKDKLKTVSQCLYEKLIGLNKFALTAPCFIVVLSEKRNLTSKMGELIKKKDYTSMDIGIASEHICLAATTLGLGTCIMGWFNEQNLKETLSIPKRNEIHLVISLGYYEKTEPRKKVRKSLNDIISFNNYN